MKKYAEIAFVRRRIRRLCNHTSGEYNEAIQDALVAIKDVPTFDVDMLFASNFKALTWDELVSLCANERTALWCLRLQPAGIAGEYDHGWVVFSAEYNLLKTKQTGAVPISKEFHSLYGSKKDYGTTWIAFSGKPDASYLYKFLQENFPIQSVDLIPQLEV